MLGQFFKSKASSVFRNFSKNPKKTQSQKSFRPEKEDPSMKNKKARQRKFYKRAFGTIVFVGGLYAFAFHHRNEIDLVYEDNKKNRYLLMRTKSVSEVDCIYPAIRKHLVFAL